MGIHKRKEQCKKKEIAVSFVVRVIFQVKYDTRRPQMKEKEFTPCALYARVSTDHDDQLRSADNQIEDLTSWIEEQGRFKLVETYEDRGLTGTKAQRPALQRMMQDAEEGKFEYIVTKSISRFARDVVISVEYARKLKNLRNPVGIYFKEEAIDTLQPGMEFTLGVLSLVAQQESENISSHVMSTFNAKIDAGIKVNGASAFGYDCITKTDGTRTLKPNKNANIVKAIFDWYASGLTTVDISQKLRKEYGLKKRATTIARLLHNDVYTGTLTQRKQKTQGVRGKRYLSPPEERVSVENNHTAIVSQELFDTVQQMMTESGRGSHSRDKHQLSGLITCGRCGNKYHRHSVRDGLAWVCGSYQQRTAGVQTDCPGKKFKTTHEETLIRLYEQAVYFLDYDMNNPKANHFTSEQVEAIRELKNEVDRVGAEKTLKTWVQGITIGTEKIDRIIRYSFDFGIDVIFETHPQDTRYKYAECTLEVRV